MVVKKVHTKLQYNEQNSKPLSIINLYPFCAQIYFKCIQTVYKMPFAISCINEIFSFILIFFWKNVPSLLFNAVIKGLVPHALSVSWMMRKKSAKNLIFTLTQMQSIIVKSVKTLLLKFRATSTRLTLLTNLQSQQSSKFFPFFTQTAYTTYKLQYEKRKTFHLDCLRIKFSSICSLPHLVCGLFKQTLLS